MERDAIVDQIFPAVGICIKQGYHVIGSGYPEPLTLDILGQCPSIWRLDGHISMQSYVAPISAADQPTDSQESAANTGPKYAVLCQMALNLQPE